MGDWAQVSKYRNKRVWTEEWGWFDSRAELDHWHILRLQERARQIEDLERQVTFELVPSVILDGRKRPSIRFRADYVFREKGQRVVADKKGFRTQGYKLKRHMMKALLGIEVKEC